MALPREGNKGFLSGLRLLFRQQRFCQTLSEGGMPAQGYPKISSSQVGYADMKKWKKVDSRPLGIDRKLIPEASWTVLKILRNHGFDAYLVGGCVRDLLLRRTPKDFDVITTANLKQIKKQFHRAQIVGQRFPICVVHIRDSVTEVSSFETVAKHAEEKEELHFSQVPRGCGKKDFILWRNSLKRDFTINSLFFDPFLNKIYDYANGMVDLRSLKLRTLIPAKVSFQEDCARILRGIRIAARLGLSFSKDTETAIHNLSSALMTLAKGRIMMELNYMFSYGAAKPSLCLLQRFNLLKIFLPFHATYLEQQISKESDQNSIMLMKLFFNLDKVVSCDHPSDCRLWVGLLAFHLALVNNPQDALVVLAFASILYHGEWKEGIRFARENAEVQVNFEPELSNYSSKSDEELAQEVSQLATLAQGSLDVLTETETLIESMSGDPISPCSGLVFIPKRTAKDVAELFQLMVESIGSYEKRRDFFDIDYHLLGKGYMWETRFVLGKVILETMGCTTSQRGEENVGQENNYIHTEIFEETLDVELSDLVKEQLQVKTDRRHSVLLHPPELKERSTKKRKLAVSKCSITEQDMTLEEQGVDERGMCQERAKKHQKIDGTDKLPREELISVLGNMSEKSCQLPDEKVIEKKKGDVKKKKRPHMGQGASMVVEKLHHVEQEDKGAEQQDVVRTRVEVKVKLKQVGKETGGQLQLPDERVIEKRKGDAKYKKRQRKDQRPSMVVEKLHHIQQEDKVAEQQDVVRTKTEAKLKQVGKETGRRLLLSDLFK